MTVNLRTWSLWSPAALLSAVALGCGEDASQRAASTTQAADGTTPVAATTTSASPPATTVPSARTEKRIKGLPGPISPPRKVSARRPTTIVGGPLFIRTNSPDGSGPRRPEDLTVVLIFKTNRDPLVRRAPDPAAEYVPDHDRGEYTAFNPAIAGDAGEVNMSGDDQYFTYRGPGHNCYWGITMEAPDYSLRRGFGSLPAGAPVIIEMKPADRRRERGGRGRVFRFKTPLLVNELDLDSAETRRQIRGIGCRVPPSLNNVQGSDYDP